MPIIQPDAAAYTRMLIWHMPQGRRLRRDPDSVLYSALQGAADELVRVSGRAKDLLADADPEQTVELMPDFEGMLGLEPEGTETERRNRVIAHLLRRARFRPVDFQATLAPLLGLDASQIPVIEHSRAFAVIVGDDREIYRFFVYRDPGLGGSYDLDSAQELTDSMAPSHTQGHVIESTAFLCDDAFSLCDRDILGGTAADTFEVVTDLVPAYLWAGTITDVVVGEVLEPVLSPEEQTAVVGLRPDNRFSNLAWRFDDGVIEAWELDAAGIFNFHLAGPSWLFFMILRTTGGPPPATRNIYSDRDSLGNGAEITMATNGRITWAVDAAFRTLTENYADDRWHVIAYRWRHDTQEMDLASELSATTPVVTGTNVSSAQSAAFGGGRLAALGCQIAYVAACSGDQVHGVDIGALCARIYDIVVPDIVLP